VLIVAAAAVLLLVGGGWLMWPDGPSGPARLWSNDGLPATLVAGTSYDGGIGVTIPDHWFPTHNHTVLVTEYLTQNGRRQTIGSTMTAIDSGDLQMQLTLPPMTAGAVTVTVTVGDFDTTSIVPNGSVAGTGQVVRATATYDHVVAAAH
jgi:hypothetical protein